MNKFLCGLLLLGALTLNLRAQEVVTNTVFVTNTVTLPTAAGTVWNDLKSATNIGVAPYFTYAPKAPTKIGGGLLAVYNVNNYVGAGIGIDWLGTFSLVSGTLELKLPTHPLANYGLPDLEFTPFVLGQIGTPMSGDHTASISTGQDVGAYLNFGHWLGGNFIVGGSYGQWTGAGDYSGARMHAFLGWKKGF